MSTQRPNQPTTNRINAVNKVGSVADALLVVVGVERVPHLHVVIAVGAAFTGIAAAADRLERAMGVGDEPTETACLTVVVADSLGGGLPQKSDANECLTQVCVCVRACVLSVCLVCA